MAVSGVGNVAMRTSSPVLLILPPVMSSAPTSRRIYGERLTDLYMYMYVHTMVNNV